MSAQNSLQLTDINEELTRLWDEEHGQNKIRASLFSLILYLKKNERTAYYQSIIKSVVSKFPCRVIMIINDTQSQEAYLKTKVSSETIGEGELKIFCEIIQIEVAKTFIERVPYLILPHILTDLPVYLLWAEDPATESAVLPHLEPLASRIIFDSGSTQELQNYSRSVLSLMQRFHCHIGDLNWSAVSGWRHIFTQLFNDYDALVPLVQSNIIRIQYNKMKGALLAHQEIKAAYLQGWLASRLNWKFQSIETNEGNIRLVYRRPLKEVVILLSPKESDTQGPGAILEIEIESSKNNAHYILKKHPQSRQVTIQYSEKEFCHLPMSCFLGSTAEGQEIIEEIFYPSGGQHYHDMLTVLALTPWRST